MPSPEGQIPNIGNSFKENVTLGEKTQEYKKRVDETAVKLHEQAILKLETKERESKLAEVIKGFGHGYDSLDGINQVIAEKDTGSKSQEQIKNAQQDKQVLIDSITRLMNSGVDQELQTRLGSGEVAKIEETFPESIQNKKIGEEVRNRVIDCPEIIKKLDRLDKIRSRMVEGSVKDQKTLSNELNKVAEEMMLMDVDEKYEDQLYSTRAYLVTEAAILENGFKSSDHSTDTADEKAFKGDSAIVEAANKMGDAAGDIKETVGEIKNTLEGMGKSFEALTSTEASDLSFQLFTKSIIENKAFNYSKESPPLWVVTPPESWTKEGKSQKEWENLVEMAANLNNYVHLKRRGDVDPTAVMNSEQLKEVTYKKVTEFLNMEVGQETMIKIFNDLFESEGRLNPDGTDSGVIRLKLVSEQKPSKRHPGTMDVITKIDPKVMEKLNDFDAYKNGLAEKLWNNGEGKVKSLEEAKIMTSIASNLLVDASNLIDSADTTRGGNIRAIDMFRTYYRPNEKFLGKHKIKGERSDISEVFHFGGKVGDMAERLLEKDTTGDFARALKNRDIAYFPDFIGLSWVETEFVKLNGQEMTFSQALLKMKSGKDKISVGDSQVTEALGKYRRDVWPAIIKTSDIMLGKETINFKSDEEILKWAKTLCNAMDDLKETRHPKIKEMTNNTMYLATAIANSWPGELHNSPFGTYIMGGYSEFTYERSVYQVLNKLTGLAPNMAGVEAKRAQLRNIFMANSYDPHSMLNFTWEKKRLAFAKNY